MHKKCRVNRVFVEHLNKHVKKHLLGTDFGFHIFIYITYPRNSRLFEQEDKLKIYILETSCKN